jgi:hypothetical protein
MAAESKYGNKFTCFACGCKFYDLHKPEAVCPRCGTNQADRTEEEEEYLEEELVEEDQVEAADDEVEVDSTDALEEDMPEMEEDLGYEETDEEE